MTAINDQTDGVSDFKLKFSYWYVTHKLRLKKGLIIFLILLNIIFFAYSIYKAVKILFFDDVYYRQAIASLPANTIDYQYFHQKNKPKDIQMVDYQITKGTEDRSDFIVKLFNPNDKFIAENIILQLVDSDSVIAEKNVFLYPGETKYAVFFNQKDTNLAGGQIRILEVDWRRYLNFSEFARPRLNFVVSDVEFRSARQAGIPGELPVSTLTFKIKND